MKHKVLFTSDIHGNEIQYKKIIEYAKRISADSIVIGGDIAPNNGMYNQRRFLKEILPFLLRGASSKIYLLMGNDDWAANMDVLEKGDPGLYRIIHGKRIKLTDDFDIVGYSYVPITPFGIKDWEKFDLSKVSSNLEVDYLHRKRTNYRLEGFKSAGTGIKKFRFKPEMEQLDSIQKDLEDKLFRENANKTIYVVHTPPNKTNLDQVARESHVGSFALKEFIEQNQPYLTLHGHIHETVDVSGDFRHKIGNTLCLSPGNDHFSDKIVVLVFDLYKPEEVRRVII